MTALPVDLEGWVRLGNALLGCAAFGLLVFRLVGRWPGMSWLSRSVVTLLAGAVLVLGLGSARAAQLNLPFNDLGWAALVVNVGAVLVGLVWQRWLDPTGHRR